MINKETKAIIAICFILGILFYFINLVFNLFQSPLELVDILRNFLEKISP